MWGYLWGKSGCDAEVGTKILRLCTIAAKNLFWFHQKVSLDLCSKKDKFSGCHKKMSNQLIGTKPLVQLRISALDVYFHLSVIAEDRFLKSAHFYYDYGLRLIFYRIIAMSCQSITESLLFLLKLLDLSKLLHGFPKVVMWIYQARGESARA